MQDPPSVHWITNENSSSSCQPNKENPVPSEGASDYKAILVLHSVDINIGCTPRVVSSRQQNMKYFRRKTVRENIYTKIENQSNLCPVFFLPVCSWPTDAVVQCTPSVEVLTQCNPSRRQANRRRRQSNNKSNKLDNFHCKQMFQSRKVPWGNVTVRRCGRLRRRSAMKHEQVKIESTRAFYDPVPLVEERGRLIRIGWEVEPSVRVMFSRRDRGRYLCVGRPAICWWRRDSVEILLLRTLTDRHTNGDGGMPVELVYTKRKIRCWIFITRDNRYNKFRRNG